MSTDSSDPKREKKGWGGEGGYGSRNEKDASRSDQTGKRNLVGERKTHSVSAAEDSQRAPKRGAENLQMGQEVEQLHTVTLTHSHTHTTLLSEYDTIRHCSTHTVTHSHTDVTDSYTVTHSHRDTHLALPLYGEAVWTLMLPVLLGLRTCPRETG